MKYIISLSSIPSRYPSLYPVLESLLAQTHKAEKIIVYIPKTYRRFPDYVGPLPVVPPGVEVRLVDKDLGPATKVLYAAEEFANQPIEILYCDDDRLYMPGWTEKFKAARSRHPGVALAAHGLHFENIPGCVPNAAQRKPKFIAMGKALDLGFHIRRLLEKIRYGGRLNVPLEKATPRRMVFRSGYADVAEGFGGVLVPPNAFDLSARDIPEVIWTVDDIWLSGQLAMKNIPIWVVAGATLFRTPREQYLDALFMAEIEGLKRDQANLACVEYMRAHFGIWAKATTT